jgi:hypothetical protein
MSYFGLSLASPELWLSFLDYLELSLLEFFWL